MPSIYDFKLSNLAGSPLALSDYQGKVILLVNVASECGLTPQYKSLQKLYTNKQKDGLVILGIPCNQFGAQEPGSASEIQAFCTTNYEITFPLTEKLGVNGENRHPLYDFLAGADARFPGDITWNFEKFLIGRNGEVLARFEPKQGPMNEDLRAALNAALGA